MKHTESHEQLQQRVIQYLYGDVDPAEREEFESELAGNPQLRLLLDREQEFDAVLPRGLEPRIDDERIQGNRWLLHQNLRKATRPRFSISARFQDLWRRPLVLASQAVAMAAAFLLGIMVAANPALDDGEAARGSVPLALINEGDYEIYRLEVNSYDATTGDIDLSFSLASETRLWGNVADRQIHRLMAVALQDDIDSASRLDTINALQPVISGDDVYEALIHVLQNDQNPGVRYQAVVALAGLAAENRVREALRRALAEDVNQGVRVEAFNALLEYRDEETMEVFRQRMINDSNEYIRTESRAVVEGQSEQAEDGDII